MARLVVQSPTSPASGASSPLSEPDSISTPEMVPANITTRANRSHDDYIRGETAGDGTEISGIALPTPTDEEESSEEDKPSFGCPHCDKSYMSQKGLNVS